MKTADKRAICGGDKGRMSKLASPAALFAACALAFAPSAGLSQAQGWVNPDVYELRDEVARLSQEIAAIRGEALNGGAPAAGASGATAPALSGDVYVRLERLDQAVRELTGALDELDQRMRAASQRRQAKLAELDFRMSRLESGETGAHRGEIPGTEALTEVPEPSDAPVAGGRLQPLQPENFGGPGSPPSVLGSLRGEQPGEQVVARPIYDKPGGANSTSSRSASPPVASVGSVRYEDALKSIQSGDLGAAEGQLQAFIEENQSDPRAGDATYWLAETYRQRGRFREAVKTYASGLKTHPRSQRAPDSWMRLGMSLAELEQVDKACEAFAQVDRRFPDAPARLLRETRKQAQRAGCR